MSQRRAGQLKADNEQVLQIWHGIIASLRTLPQTSDAVLQKLNLYYPSLADGDAQHDSDWIVAKRALVEDFEREAKYSEKQARVLATAQEQMDILLALKRADGATTPINSSAGDTLKRKRARLSPSSSLRLSPAVSSPHPSSQPMGPRSASPAITATSSSAPTTKQRREALAGQLPLAPGRSVAFRLPPKAAAAKTEEKEEQTGETWILAKIEKCINSDKSRYMVRDVDEADDIFNTTIRSIVPLPDPTAPPSSPSHPSQYYDQPRGSQVLAIYPDTTSFYRATVLIPPIPGTGNGIGVQGQMAGAKKGKYVLQFEDDDELSKEVLAGFVVEYPGVN